MVYTCTYNVCTCLTFLNMYIHVKYMSIPFFQILSRWSGFQMIWNPSIHLVHASVGKYQSRYVPICTDLYYDIVCTGTYYLENVA